jgi:hypothetical protein
LDLFFDKFVEHVALDYSFGAWWDDFEDGLSHDVVDLIDVDVLLQHDVDKGFELSLHRCAILVFRKKIFVQESILYLFAISLFDDFVDLFDVHF